LRIITGNLRGRQIHPPSFFHDRPTTDYAKESLFNIITNSFEYEKINVLDLFAGTGNISYEFASRGCNNITCVELNKKYCDFIKKTLNDFNVLQVKVINSDVFYFLKHIDKKFSVIFADPPYNLDKIVELPELIFKNNLLENEGIFILEHGNNNKFDNNEYFVEERVYGAVHFTFFKYK
jgi:16S rRNA (guanine(966)-N(2))-methyltransferase RsmD